MNKPDSIHNRNLLLTDTDARLPRLALRPKDAAHAVGISERLLWAKTKSGEIPHCRIGTAVIYPLRLLQEYLEKSAKGGENHG